MMLWGQARFGPGLLAAGTLSSIIFVLPGLIMIGDLRSAEAASEL
jgi:uncharacterized oligopeptide transporter (OPT) family protein